MTNAIPTLSPLLAVDAPLLLWSSGRVSMRPEGQGRFMSQAGFYSEAGKFEELDAACQAARLPRVEIRHQSGATKLHWS